MAEATESNRRGESSSRSFPFFWRKKNKSSATEKKAPADATRTGCGGLFRRKARSKDGAMIQQQRQQPLESSAKMESQAPKASQSVHITFDDVELPDVPIPDSDENGSVHSVCEEVVCVKVKEVESAWVRPPISAPAKDSKQTKPLALAKRASKDGGPQSTANEPGRQSVSGKSDDTPPAADKDDEAEAERQRVAEARFQRKSVDMRNVKATGGVKIEQTPQSDMWWSIVNKSLVGTGLFSRAVVCSLTTGGVFACNPADFAPSAEQVAALRDNFQNPDAFSAAGFAVGGTLYKVEQDGCTQDLMSGVNLQHTEGLLIVKTRTALIIAGFTGGRDQASETLSDLRDLFVQQGL